MPENGQTAVREKQDSGSGVSMAARGLDKAAALLLALGVERSSSILQHLGEGELERVLLALSETGSVGASAKYEVLREVHALLMAESGMIRGDIEYTRQLLSKAVGPRRGAEILERISAHHQLSSFDIVRNADPAQVATLLQEEHPQTIALVLSYLEAKLAADILANMPAEAQTDVTLRLAQMDRISPAVVRVVESGLKQKLSGVASEADFKATGGVAFLVKVLNQVDRGVQKQIFDELEVNNARLADEIRQNMFTFDDLIQLDDRSMQRVLRDINKQELTLALKGAPEELKELILRNMSERARQNVEEELQLLGPQLAKNVYAAQRSVVEVVRKLEESEEIMLSGVGGGGEELIY